MAAATASARLSKWWKNHTMGSGKVYITPRLPMHAMASRGGMVLKLGMTSRGVRVGAQALAPVPQEHGHGGSSIMERFKRMAPPSFKGESQPLLAES
ncbi:hypothetical protein Taro_046828 [Colocasia esculenta]|uniref:Uncharacterized protein n=1 Tax=Colocasia esculenta TaxID=4460 RepID=A0A843X4M9_COLES|nr:hypothetical protein [Colocasia esculenta]